MGLTRGGGWGRLCSDATGATSVSLAIRMPGKEKEKHCDFAGVADALLVSQDPDSDHAQDVVGL